MAVRKYIYTFNGQPFSLELDLGDPEGTEVINLGELADKAKPPVSNTKPTDINTDFPVYTKTAFGFSGGSSFNYLDFEQLELMDIIGAITVLDIKDPDYGVKRSAYDNQWNQKFLDMIIREAKELDKEYKRYASTYGGNYSISNDIKKTLGIVSSVSSVVVPMLAQQAFSTAIATGASVAAAQAAGTAVTASFTAVFSTIMPILSLAVVGLSIVEQTYTEEAKKKLEESLLARSQYIRDSMDAIKQKILSDSSKTYTSIYVPEIDEKELQKIIDQIANTPVSNYYSAPSSKIDYWIVLAVVLFLLFLIIRRRQRQ
ncbi:hypothetical protein ACWA1C_09185 [Flectobacillus roseus]